MLHQIKHRILLVKGNEQAARPLDQEWPFARIGQLEIGQFDVHPVYLGGVVGAGGGT